MRAELGQLKDRIVFEGYDENNWELFSIKPDGSDLKNLTNTPNEHEMYAQASPDGKKIAYVRDVEQDGTTIRSVYMMDADGSNKKKIADQARQPCWSPDSKQVAYLNMEFGKFNIADYASKGLFIYDVATGEIREAGNKSVHHIYVPNWSPDGKWIVTTVHGGMGFKHGIIAIEIDGDKVIDLSISGCRPCISDDGKRLTWSSNDHTIGIADLNFDGGSVKLSNAHDLVHDESLHLYHPDLSPDGQYVVFSMGPGGRVAANGPGTHTQVAEMVGVRGKWDLMAKRCDGSGPLVQLTFGEDSTSKEAEWIVGD